MSFLEIPDTPTLYTVYTKSNCSYCDKIKQLMEEYNENANYILCDEWLVNKRILFLNIMNYLHFLNKIFIRFSWTVKCYFQIISSRMIKTQTKYKK
jgi:hypothetical protein